MYSAELLLELGELDALTAKRREVRDRLEKSIALWKATGIRPTRWVSKDFYPGEDPPLQPQQTGGIAGFFGSSVYDAIEHYTHLLAAMNDEVSSLQGKYRRQVRERSESAASEVRGRLEQEARGMIGFMKNTVVTIGKSIPGSSTMHEDEGELVQKQGYLKEGLIEGDTLRQMKAGEPAGGYNSDFIEQNDEENTATNPVHTSSAIATDNADVKRELAPATQTNYFPGKHVLTAGTKIVGGAANLAESSVGTLAKEAQFATSGMLRGAQELGRTVELLTLGAAYKRSSTAFVTLNNRVSKTCAHQMLLSHNYFTMDVKSAANSKDIIWSNVSIPQQQIDLRTFIADATVLIGALFWATIIFAIGAISNLQTLAQNKGFGWLDQYKNSPVYQFFNSYLYLGLLLILLAILPFIFDIIARNYQGLKLESEIQNTIMLRYFYYQLANVYVALLGSLTTAINAIIAHPATITTYLGTNIPSFSVYFTDLIILKTFTAVPIEVR